VFAKQFPVSRAIGKNADFFHTRDVKRPDLNINGLLAGRAPDITKSSHKIAYQTVSVYYVKK
jgi:hypothetical protein